MAKKKGKLFIVGIGPGGQGELTVQAQKALKACEVIVGYSSYIKLVAPFCKGKVIIASGMGKEPERCKAALREALLGRTVALVSSGDSGIYGMAGLALEIALQKGIEDTSTIEIVPGVPAFVAAAARVGAPLMNDFACISLSDLLTPWKKIEQRLTAAAQGDFVTCLYNPKSKKRIAQIQKAHKIFLKHRDKKTPCAILKNISRRAQSITITTLKELLDHDIDMLCIIIIGSSETIVDGKWMITPRGYKLSGS
ncbi:MAG: precorrin-3B C(17)-methyltransferase [Pseudomonadota bacterium]